MLATVALLLAGLWLGPCAQAQTDRRSDAVLACADLASPQLADASGKPIDFSQIPDAITRITKASVVQPANGVPAYCNASGYIANSIGFELHLPLQAWNQKFAMVGCGGMCGYVQTEACDTALIKGYACIFTDMGHSSRQTDVEWADNNLRGVIDFGYRATHLAAVAGKAITEAFYGRQPTRAYYMGCSTGGRQGYMEAQRFPTDFNGIIAGAPPMSELGNAMAIVWAIEKLNDPDGKPRFTPGQLDRLHQAALAACDGLDGLKDGVIGNVPACHFDPRTLVCGADAKPGCLSAAQADDARDIYAGPQDSRGHILYPGFLPGTELEWIARYLNKPNGESGPAGHAIITSYKSFMTGMFRYMAFIPSAGPGWTLDKLDWDRDPERMRMVGALLDPDNPDLHAFRDAGGKFIGFHGWADSLVPPMASAHYADAVDALMGGRAKVLPFFRLFMMPGMHHCLGGEGAYATDTLGALEDWVERGVAPDRLLSVRPRDTKAVLWPQYFTPEKRIMDDAEYARPVFPYPAVATYVGHGDTHDPANFVGREP